MKTTNELAAAVKNFLNGDHDIFNKIYELSNRYLYTCIYYVVKDEEAAKDLLQETYLEISSKLNQLENTESFMSWAAVIANRKCLAYLKKNKEIRLEESKEGETLIETIADDEKLIPESMIQDQEKQRLVREIINGLSDMQRLCVIGYYYSEETQEQIAEELGIPLNTVKSHLNRAKAQIKKAVLDLEKKEGTKLYGIAPFLLLFFSKEVEACEIIPMSQAVKAAFCESGNTAAGGKLAKLGLKTKLGIGIGAAAAAAVIGGAIVLGTMQGQNQDSAGTQTEESQENTDNTIEMPVPKEQIEEEQIEEEEIAPEEAPGFTVLPISGEYDQYGTAFDGRILVCKDGKWGMVTYEGEELIPLEYTNAFSNVNNDGQTVFEKDGVYHIFDWDGNQITETTQPVRTVSDGVILIVDQNTDTQVYNYQYQTLEGEVIYEPDMPGWIGQMGAVGFNDGHAIAEDGSKEICLSKDGSYTSLMEARAEGILKQEELPDSGTDNSGNVLLEVNGASGNQGSTMTYPIGVYHNGYYVARGMDFEDTYGDYYVSDIDGRELYQFRMRDFYEYAGYDFWTSDVSWSIYGYAVNGSLCYSYGTIMSITLQDGDERTCYLIDISKLNWEVQSSFEPPKMIITEESILATGQRIYLSDDSYWVIQKDGKYGYIDHAGNVMEMFDDASDFVNGRAAVIEDGKVYFIDEEFHRIETEFTADYVGINYGDMLLLANGDERICLIPE